MPDGQHPPFRQLRLAAGLTIRQLERRTGINRGRLSIIDRGVSPSEEEARLLIEALQVTVVPPPEDEEVA